MSATAPTTITTCRKLSPTMHAYIIDTASTVCRTRSTTGRPRVVGGRPGAQLNCGSLDGRHKKT